MKKIYTFILVSMFALASFNANATIRYITVGASGNSFVPSSITNVMVGDTVQWILVAGTHYVQSGVIPSGAASFVSAVPLSSGVPFNYHVTVAGLYNYTCPFHAPGMAGTFTASGAGITDPTVSPLTSAFPNPCVDKLIFKYNGIDKIEVYNVVGEKVKALDLGANEGTIEMNLEGMTSGIYFYRTYKDGLVYETRKIVKSK